MAATAQEPREAAGTEGGLGWAGRTVDRLVFVFWVFFLLEDSAAAT